MQQFSEPLAGDEGCCSTCLGTSQDRSSIWLPSALSSPKFSVEFWNDLQKPLTPLGGQQCSRKGDGVRVIVHDQDSDRKGRGVHCRLQQLAGLCLRLPDCIPRSCTDCAPFFVEHLALYYHSGCKGACWRKQLHQPCGIAPTIRQRNRGGTTVARTYECERVGIWSFSKDSLRRRSSTCREIALAPAVPITRV
jgi:hypothetical protein